MGVSVAVACGGVGFVSVPVIEFTTFDTTSLIESMIVVVASGFEVVESV